MNNNRTKELLVYIIKQHAKASITVLMKLSYLIDLISVKEENRQISAFNYVRYLYGPYDSLISNLLDDLVKCRKVIISNTEYTYTGGEYVVYSFNEEVDNFQFKSLSEKDIKIVDQVLEQLKGYGAKTLTEIAYKTKPMKKIGAAPENAIGIGEKLNLKCD